MRKITFGITVFFMVVLSCQSSIDKSKSVSIKNPNEISLSSELNDLCTDTLNLKNVPNGIVRSAIQNENGHLWFATFNGIMRYDGKSFDHITKDISQSRFFSVLEDQKGDLWFGSIGSGVYKYDGKTFQNLTTDDGLLNNEVTCIYEDKKGDIWLGVNGGVSRFDGHAFQNYIIDKNGLQAVKAGIAIPNMNRPPHEVNAIIEDDAGHFWFATRDYSFIYDGKKSVRIDYDGQPFHNIRSMIKDTNGNIWIGGEDGLWRFDNTFNKLSENFINYIYEDHNGNIWTTSEGKNEWVLSKYEHTLFINKQMTVTNIASGQIMLFGILEDIDGHIWIGSLDGVFVYNGEFYDKI